MIWHIAAKNEHTFLRFVVSDFPLVWIKIVDSKAFNVHNIEIVRLQIVHMHAWYKNNDISLTKTGLV